MATLKLAKASRELLIDAINRNISAVIQLSSRMIVDPSDGIRGSITLPLTKTQLSKLNLSKRASNFKLSKAQIGKLRRGNGFFGDVWGGIKSAASFVGKTALNVGKSVAEDALKTAIQAAPALLMGAGTASISAPVNGGKMIVRNAPPLVNSPTVARYYISGT